MDSTRGPTALGFPAGHASDALQAFATTPPVVHTANVQQPNCTHAYTSTQVFMRLYVGLPVTAFGILANALNICVFAAKPMRQSHINWFLLALAVSDLCLLLCTQFFLYLPVIAEATGNFNLVFLSSYITFIFYPAGLTLQTFAVYLTIVISVHRFIGVCHPFLMMRIDSAKTTLMCLLAVTLLALGYNATSWFEIRVTSCCDVSNNVNSTMVQATELLMYYNYFLWHKVVGYTVFMFLVPFAILLVVNSFIVNTLRRSNMLRKKMTYQSLGQPSPCCQTNRSEQPTDVIRSRQTDRDTPPLSPNHQQSRSLNRQRPLSACLKTIVDRRIIDQKEKLDKQREKSTTVMLLGIVALFIVCNTPALVNNVLDVLLTLNLLGNKLGPPNWFTVSVDIGNLLVVVSPSMSAVIYLAFGSKYRAVAAALRARVWAALLTRLWCGRRAEYSRAADDEDDQNVGARLSHGVLIITAAVVDSSASVEVDRRSAKKSRRKSKKRVAGQTPLLPKAHRKTGGHLTPVDTAPKRLTTSASHCLGDFSASSAGPSGATNPLSTTSSMSVLTQKSPNLGRDGGTPAPAAACRGQRCRLWMTATGAAGGGGQVGWTMPSKGQQRMGQTMGRWTLAELKQTDALIPLQSGTNRHASQKGMTGFGTPRDVKGTHLKRIWELEYPEEVDGFGDEQTAYQQDV